MWCLCFLKDKATGKPEKTKEKKEKKKEKQKKKHKKKHKKEKNQREKSEEGQVKKAGSVELLHLQGKDLQAFRR